MMTSTFCDCNFFGLEEHFPSHIAPTSLLSWEQCPRMYFRQSILWEKPPDYDDRVLRFGSLCHKNLQDFYPALNDDVLTELINTGNNPKKYFEQVLDNISISNWDYTLDETYKTEMYAINKKFVDYRVNNWNTLLSKNRIEEFLPHSVEEKIVSDKYGVKAVVDFLHKTKTATIDYKTTKKFPDHLIKERPKDLVKQKQYDVDMDSYVVQAVLNALVVKEKYGVLPTQMVYLFLRHLDAKKYNYGKLVVPIRQTDIDSVLVRVNRMKQALIERAFPKTDNTQHCLKFGGCKFKPTCAIQDLCIYNL